MSDPDPVASKRKYCHYYKSVKISRPHNFLGLLLTFFCMLHHPKWLVFFSPFLQQEGIIDSNFCIRWLAGLLSGLILCLFLILLKYTDELSGGRSKDKRECLNKSSTVLITNFITFEKHQNTRHSCSYRIKCSISFHRTTIWLSFSSILGPAMPKARMSSSWQRLPLASPKKMQRSPGRSLTSDCKNCFSFLEVISLVFQRATAIRRAR